MADARTRKFQPVDTKRDFGGRKHHRVYSLSPLSSGGKHTRNGFAKALFGADWVWALHQARSYVAAISTIQAVQAAFAVIEFIELKFGRGMVQMCHALADHRRTSRRNEQLQAFDVSSLREVLAAVVQPKDA